MNNQRCKFENSEWLVIKAECGTDRPFMGKYNSFFEDGIYFCSVCNQELFSSTEKYDSGTGWPAFKSILNDNYIILRKDTTAVGMNILRIIKDPTLLRTSVSCALCKSHLGHLFNDGPKPSGKRYCINSSALIFKSSSQLDKIK